MYPSKDGTTIPVGAEDRVRIVSTRVPLKRAGVDKATRQFDSSPLYDPAFLSTPDHSTRGGTFIFPINGPVPITLMIGSDDQFMHYRNYLGYTMTALLCASRRGAPLSGDDSRLAQDRLIATTLEAVDRMTGLNHDFEPCRYVVNPGHLMFIPNHMMVRRGGYLPADTTQLERAIVSSYKPDAFLIHYIEVTVSETDLVCNFASVCDPRDMQYYFPLVNYIPSSHVQPGAQPYERSRGEIPSVMLRSWRKVGAVRLDPYQHDEWGYEAKDDPETDVDPLATDDDDA